jgi:Family of unknown function (DUF6527)
MSTKSFRFLRVVPTRGEASAYLKAPGDAVIVERGRARLLMLVCPCGCGEELPINLDSRAGPAWRLYQNRRAGLSLFPSVWRESGCESHFIIWRDKIFLFGQYDDDGLAEPEALEPVGGVPLVDAVREQLSDELVPFADIAERLEAVPWDILTACRQLVRKGLAHEGGEEGRGSFCRS